MTSHLYATFHCLADAEAAYQSMIAEGALPSDLTIAAIQRFDGCGSTTTAGTPNNIGEGVEEDRPAGASPDVPDCPTHEELPTQQTPFGEVPGGPRIALTMNYPGDLFTTLTKMGIEDATSILLTEKVMSGGAVLFVQVPSGNVTEDRANEIIAMCGGSGMAKTTKTAYVV